MLELESLRLKNALLFKDVEFKFVPGLTTIYGLNKVSGKATGNGNGAGKSFFFSQIREILHEEPMVGQKTDVLKTGTRSLGIKIEGKRYKIDRAKTGLKIMSKGKSKFRTKPLAKAWLKKLPLTAEDFDTYVHLDARVPHPLVMGKSTERKKFFTSFFGLDRMDVERRLFMAELSKLAKVKAAYKELRVEYEKAKEKIEGLDLDALKTKGRKLRVMLDDLHEKNKRLQNITQLLAFERTAKKQVEQYLKLVVDDLSAERFDELMADVKYNIKVNKADLAEAQAWREYQKDVKRYHKALERLSPSSQKMLEKYSAKDIRKKFGSAEEDRMHVAASVMETENRIKYNKKLTKPTKVEDPQIDPKELRAKLESLEHRYDHARKFKTGVCDTCGQEVKTVDPKELKRKITKIEVQLENHEEYKTYVKERDEYKRAVAELAEDEPQLEVLQAKHDKLRRRAKVFDEIQGLPDKPTKFEGKKLEVEILERMLEEDRERVALLEFIQPNLQTIEELVALTDKQRGAYKIAQALQDKINDYQEKLSKVKVKVEMGKENLETYNRLRKRLKEMKVELEDEEALKLLVDSYSDKGAKRLAIKAISSRLMTEVNKYARIVFGEDFDFFFKWESSDLVLGVNRRYGKKVITSDVRKLSGAESKLFTYVLMAASMTFRSERKRCNVLILDEPTANFSPETFEMFKKLVPILNKIFPTIIIITPKSDERYEGADEWTVTKTKTEAKLVRGHPHQIRNK